MTTPTINTTANTVPEYNFVPLTYEQVRETLIRLQWYAYHTYHTIEGVRGFETHQFERNGHKNSFSVREDGKIVLTRDDGVKAIYDVVACADKLEPGTLDHFTFRYTILNHDELSKENFTYMQEMGAFVLSYAQRNLCFQFLQRMQPISIHEYARTLASMTPKTI